MGKSILSLLHLGSFGGSSEDRYGLPSTENSLLACLLVYAGCQLGPARASDQNTYMRHFHVAAWLPPGMETVSQENQEEALKLYDLPCKLSIAILVVVTSAQI